MKNLFLAKFFSLVTLLSIHTIAFSQSYDTFIPHYMKGDSIKEFEKVGAKMESKTIGMGYGGVNNYYTVFGSPKSSVRFSANAVPKFVMSVDQGTEPFQLVIISKADVTKKPTNYRRFVSAGFAATGTKDMSAYQVVPEMKLIKDNLYEIVMPKLVPGEYMFMPIYKGMQAANIYTSTGNFRMFCFGVD